MSKDNISCDNLLLKLQQLEFAAVDLNLFLDNNPDNRNAIMDYNVIAREISKIKEIYEQQFGPLTNFGCSESPYPWTWVDDPWPWEYEEFEE